MPMLASDLLNPQFVGARNPDELLAVEFYWGQVKDVRGRPALDANDKPLKVPYVRISIPGNDTSMVDTPVRPEHKIRFKRQWDFWQAQEIEHEMPAAVGWPIDDWDEIDEQQRRDLKYLRFTIVEQLAQASDSTLQRIGPSGQSLKIRANAALRKRAEEHAKQEAAAREKEMADLRAGMAAMAAKIAELETAKPPRKPKGDD